MLAMLFCPVLEEKKQSEVLGKPAISAENLLLLYEAIGRSDLPAVRNLSDEVTLSPKATVNPYTISLIQYALFTPRNKLAIIRCLLAADASVNSNHGGRTALHLAAMHGYNDAAALLIERKANLDEISYTYEGKRPLHFAARQSNEALVALMLAQGANPRLTSEGAYLALRDSPLHTAMQTPNNIGCISMLLNENIHPFNVNSVGKSPLQVAVDAGARLNVTCFIRYFINQEEERMSVELLVWLKEVSESAQVCELSRFSREGGHFFSVITDYSKKTEAELHSIVARRMQQHG
jgi:ankyrin repeat protein